MTYMLWWAQIIRECNNGCAQKCDEQVCHCMSFESVQCSGHSICACIWYGPDVCVMMSAGLWLLQSWPFHIAQANPVCKSQITCMWCG